MLKRASCGLDFNSPTEICSSLKLASGFGFQFVCLPLVHPRFKREFVAKWKDRPGPLTRTDLVLKTSEWSSLIAGKISPYLNIDSEFLNGQAKLALEQELSYGSHLNVPAVIIPIRNSKFFNLARIINSNLTNLKSFQIWLEIPIISHQKNASAWRSDVLEGELEENTWEWWSNFLTLCNFDRKLGLVLEITKTIPDEKELQIWLAEPIKCLIISTSTFLTNKGGYPVLSKAIQSFIRTLVPNDIQVIIKGNNHHLNFDYYQKYIDHLWQEASTQQVSEPNDASSIKTSLQYSLPPFDKEPKTYEILKKDSVKYREYAKAVYQGILDQVSEENKSTKIVNIMVVGPESGPLVFTVFGAAAESNIKAKIFAVENNPYTVVNLQVYQEELWKDAVDIISEDIRFLKFPQIIDIIVSASVGYFGDNVLCPEILDEAQKFLRRGGISIPERYTSYICPLQSSRTYGDVKADRNYADCEIPYPVTRKQKYNISSMKSLFSFHHPNYSRCYLGERIDNSRYRRLLFETERKCTLHGFTGYFEVILYKDIKLSILPHSHTPGLDSWDPIFFPLLEPVPLKTGDELEVHFWRLVEQTKVWYEWTVTKPMPLPIHNPNGRSSIVNFR